MKKTIYLISIVIFFSGCKYNPQYVQQEFCLSDEFEYTLTYWRYYDFPVAEIIFEGHINGKGILNYFYPPYGDQDIFYNGFIIHDKIEIREETTWYGNTVLIKYIPLEQSEGKLLVKFKVF